MATSVGGVYVGLGASSAELVTEMSKASAAVAGAAQKMQASLTQASSGFAKFSTNVGGLRSGLAGFSAAARSVGAGLAVIGIGLGARAIKDYADSWTLAENQLKLVSSSTEQATAIHEALFAAAQRLGIGISSLTTIYTRTARSAETLGISAGDVLKTTEALGAAIKVSGATAIEASGALIQLSQAFARGNLQGQELRTISTQLPVILDAVATATGKTRAEVIAFGTDGGIAADLVAKSVIRMGATWAAQSDRMHLTFGQAIEKINNSIRRILGISFAAGAFNPITESLSKLADALDSPAVIIAIQQIGTSIIDMATTITTQVIPAIADLATSLRTELAPTFATTAQEARALIGVLDKIIQVAARASVVIPAITSGAIPLAQGLQLLMLTGDPAGDLETVNKEIEVALKRRQELLDKGFTAATSVAVAKQSEAIDTLKRQQAELVAQLGKAGGLRVEVPEADLAAIAAAQKKVDELAATVASLTAAGAFDIKLDIAVEDLGTAQKKLQDLVNKVEAAQLERPAATAKPVASFRKYHPERLLGPVYEKPGPPDDLRHGVPGHQAGADTLANKIAAARRSIAELATSADDLGKIEDELGKKSQELGRTYQAFAKVITDPAERAQALGRILEALAVSEEEGAAKVRKISEEFRAAGAIIGLSAESMHKLESIQTEPLRGAVELMARLAEEADTTEAKQAKLAATTKELVDAYNQLAASGALSADELRKQQAQVGATLAAAAERAKPPPSEADKQAEQDKQARQSRIESGGKLPDDIDAANIAASNLASTLSDVNNLTFDSLRQSLANIAQQIAQVIIQALIFRTAMAAFGPTAPAAGGTTGAGGAGFSLPFFGGPRAEGGPISPGVVYAVGEAGVEAFVEGASSQAAAVAALTPTASRGILAPAVPVRGEGAEFYQIASRAATEPKAPASSAAYLVGTSGVELFRSPVAGQIVPHARLEALASVTAAAPAASALGDVGDPGRSPVFWLSERFRHARGEPTGHHDTVSAPREGGLAQLARIATAAAAPSGEVGDVGDPGRSKPPWLPFFFRHARGASITTPGHPDTFRSPTEGRLGQLARIATAAAPSTKVLDEVGGPGRSQWSWLSVHPWHARGPHVTTQGHPGTLPAPTEEAQLPRVLGPDVDRGITAVQLSAPRQRLGFQFRALSLGYRLLGVKNRELELQLRDALPGSLERVDRAYPVPILRGQDAVRHIFPRVEPHGQVSVGGFVGHEHQSILRGRLIDPLELGAVDRVGIAAAIERQVAVLASDPAVARLSDEQSVDLHGARDRGLAPTRHLVEQVSGISPGERASGFAETGLRGFERHRSFLRDWRSELEFRQADGIDSNRGTGALIDSGQRYGAAIQLTKLHFLQNLSGSGFAPREMLSPAVPMAKASAAPPSALAPDSSAQPIRLIGHERLDLGREFGRGERQRGPEGRRPLFGDVLHDTSAFAHLLAPSHVSRETKASSLLPRDQPLYREPATARFVEQLFSAPAGIADPRHRDVAGRVNFESAGVQEAQKRAVGHDLERHRVDGWVRHFDSSLLSRESRENRVTSATRFFEQGLDVFGADRTPDHRRHDRMKRVDFESAGTDSGLQFVVRQGADVTRVLGRHLLFPKFDRVGDAHGLGAGDRRALGGAGGHRPGGFQFASGTPAAPIAGHLATLAASDQEQRRRRPSLASYLGGAGDQPIHGFQAIAGLPASPVAIPGTFPDLTEERRRRRSGLASFLGAAGGHLAWGFQFCAGTPGAPTGHIATFPAPEQERRRRPNLIQQLGHLMPRASGGTIHPGHPYEVGEQGRELVIKGDGAAQLVGESGREILIPSSQMVVVPHAQTEAILSTVTLPGLASGGSTPSGPDIFGAGNAAQQAQPAQTTDTKAGDTLQFDLRGMSAGAVADALNNVRMMAQQQVWHDLSRSRTARRSVGMRGGIR